MRNSQPRNDVYTVHMQRSNILTLLQEKFVLFSHSHHNDLNSLVETITASICGWINLSWLRKCIESNVTVKEEVGCWKLGTSKVHFGDILGSVGVRYNISGLSYFKATKCANFVRAPSPHFEWGCLLTFSLGPSGRRWAGGRGALTNPVPVALTCTCCYKQTTRKLYLSRHVINKFI